jgi:hypothetical protein
MEALKRVSDRAFVLNPDVHKLATCTIVYMLINELQDAFKVWQNSPEYRHAPSVICYFDKLRCPNDPDYIRRIAYNNHKGFSGLTAIRCPPARRRAEMGPFAGEMRYIKPFPDWESMSEADIAQMVEKWKRALPAIQAREKRR